ncbi:hypothetical protein NB706_002590 [Xanthomonas sacchari]|nr:hypothetical protein [Xanthomonas sacchari]
MRLPTATLNAPIVTSLPDASTRNVLTPLKRDSMLPLRTVLLPPNANGLPPDRAKATVAAV